MSGSEWAELLAEASEQLAEQEAEEQEANAELGDVVDLAERESFTGRWRGFGKASTKRGEVEVNLFWDSSGGRRFMWSKTRLQRELDEQQPNIGDLVAVVRGADIPNSDPDRSPTQRYAVRVRRPSEEPADVKPADSSDDIPF